MHRPFVPFSVTESSTHTRSLADCITTTFGFRFSVHTIVRRFNATLSAKGKAWFWPKIGAALVSKHHWLVIVCDNCGTMVDLDLGVKLRDSEASIRVALRDVQCPRCSGYGRVKSMFLHLMFQMRRWNVRESFTYYGCP